MTQENTAKAAVEAYLKEVEQALRRGDATEHTLRPALKTLLEALSQKKTEATNEPKRIACGAPDFVISRKGLPIGHLEAKDVGTHLDGVEKTEQFQRYLEGLPNLLLTDYLEFRWYKEGAFVQPARLARQEPSGKLHKDPEGADAFNAVYAAFLDADLAAINTPKDLAGRLAGTARLLAEAIVQSLQQEAASEGTLHSQLEGFRTVLLHELDEAGFADMYAQTVCYGLFAARCNHGNSGTAFTRQTAVFEIPETNPFLQEMFQYMAGPRLDASIAWAVDQVAALLDKTDIEAILKDFGRRTRQEDPVVHFYETFLAAYNPELRETRGVYYTPEPVVSFIVRSVDAILKRDFALRDGLASTEKTTVTTTLEDGPHREEETHRVLILDPAAGTGTFLHGVIDQIHQQMLASGQGGTWPGYVSQHLLPRLFGFELLMAPYAVAHMKLGIQLRETGYEFGSGERVRVYLTNTLERAFAEGDLLPFAQTIAQEAVRAGHVKAKAPVMVVLGNPPYSGHSENKGEWIHGLMRGRDATDQTQTADYFKVDGKPLGERNPKWLNDDYVKFIRFGQWRIEQTGHGVLAFISNHGYLDNPTFRGMRQSLMDTFDDIYILDLHGNTKKKEAAPDGGKDENVFDIQQGVAIGIFVKREAGDAKQPARVRHADCWGPREIKETRDGENRLVGGKYRFLEDHSCETVQWQKLHPTSPGYLFIPRDVRLEKEYMKGWSVKDIFPVHSVGMVTARDKLTIHWSPEEVWRTVKDFAQLKEEEARDKYRLGPDARDWKVAFAQQDLRDSGPSKDNIVPVLYRPFDKRWTYYTGHSRGFICKPRGEVMGHMLETENLALISCRNIEISRGWENVLCTNIPIEHHTVSLKEVNYLYPLRILENGYANVHSTNNGSQGELPCEKAPAPNLSEAFLHALTTTTGLSFKTNEGNGKTGVSPEDIFHYIYAILHSRAYRERYEQYLRSDFPRIPLTRNLDLFRALCGEGARLTALHLMETDIPFITRFSTAGSNTVEAIRYVDEHQRVYINDTQCFEGIPPSVWEFCIGGYRVCHKWLKDRRERALTYDDLRSYQYIVAALHETLDCMTSIDDIIEEQGGWPIK